MAQKNRLYPHLLEEDIILWEQYLEDHANEYSSFDYDVRVGTGRDPGEDLPDNMRKMGIGLSQRRIDVVGFAQGHRDIIEITLYAGLKAMGQLSVYPLLYIESYGCPVPLRRVLLCRKQSPDIDSAIQAYGIYVYKYPDPPVT